jgi:predicted unusual protein kinase regulating ubiquinone biosynthesis (AarF/ABC1/UbiB family)
MKNKNGSKDRKLRKIKSSVFARGLSLARLTLNTGAQLAGHGLSTLLSEDSVKNEKWNEFLKQQANSFSQEMGELKGSIMKAGQMLSMFGEYFLPPEANQFLKTLQSQSPALEWPEIEKALKKNMPAEKLAELEIDPQPIGSASLGQVHKAKIKKPGQWIALKIQYPGVDKAIDSDLKAMRSFLSLSKLLPRNLQTDHLFEEVRMMLHQEMDYSLEMTATKQYGERLKGDTKYVVPEVIEEFCFPKIIATSFETGLSADDPLIQSLPIERRNKIALNFLELYFKELFDWGVVQTDPHLGNYRIRLSPSGSDQIVLLDFGAVRAYSPEFMDQYRKMVKSAVLNDDGALKDAALNLKFLSKEDDPQLIQMFVDFCHAMVEPFASGVYDWKSSDLPPRLTRKVFQMIQKFHLRPPPREVIFLDRKIGGVFIFLGILNSKFDGRPLLNKYL